MGVHQRIDRVARRHIITHISSEVNFPLYRDIVHFEGLNGPDGIKRKSPAQDEPWHYINPDDPLDTNLLEMIEDHIENMAEALRTDNYTRVAFEAAWMAHAITDGLTPAHHFPLEEKLEQRGFRQLVQTQASAIPRCRRITTLVPIFSVIICYRNRTFNGWYTAAAHGKPSMGGRGRRHADRPD